MIVFPNVEKQMVRVRAQGILVWPAAKEMGRIKGSLGQGDFHLTQIHIFHGYGGGEIVERVVGGFQMIGQGCCFSRGSSTVAQASPVLFSHLYL